ncbi:MAG: sugar porter family MFS transporter [Bryobacterales bacterium]|nr:sugar porter family MFS transporter [Bryobacterales bacterium]
MPSPPVFRAGADPVSGEAAVPGHTLYAYMVSLVAAASGLLFGFDIAVINGAILLLRQQFALTEFQTEVAASSLLIGCVFGASLAGISSDRFGRRGILIVSAILFALSSAGAALPRDLAEFTAARFAGGLAIGVASVLAPLYIAEVSPARIRGRLVSLNQMAIVTGILLAYLVNWLLSYHGPESWRWMFAAAILPSVAFFAGLLFVPESPRWLVENGAEDKALRVLTRVSGEAQARREMEEIKTAIAGESGSLRELLQPGLRRALLIAVTLAVLQQITGINTVLFYGSIIFKERVGGHTETAAIGANVIIGLVNFVATIVALWLIDRAGRRRLLMCSAGVMAFAQLLLGIAFLLKPPPAAMVLPAMLFCVAAFAVGLGPGVWVVLAEIFPTRIRGRAMSIATISLWMACVALTMTFLSLAQAISISGAFWLYSGLCVVTFLFVLFVTPETKGKTLEEIEEFWYRDRRG